MPEVFTTDFLDEVRLARIDIAVQHQQLVCLRMARSNGMGFQFAKLRCEILLLHRGDVLVAKEQHFVLEP
ncbi:hypothetical protein D3C73_1448740 [compost metagenome]